MPTDTELRTAKRDAARVLRVKVGRQVDRVVADLVQAYARAWQQTRDELLRAITEAEAQAASLGQRPEAGMRTQRLQAALDALTVQLRQLNAYAGVTVSGVVPATVTAPGLVFVSLARLSGLAPEALAATTLQAIVQRTTSAIASDYRKLTPAAEEALRQSLVQGITQGKGPRDVARTMIDTARAEAAARYGLTVEQVNDLRRAGVAEDVVGAVRGAFAGGEARALTLARTELIDASRFATTTSYVASGMVTGWRWVSALDSRTCPACWGMHNSVHGVTEHQLGHQNCRCTQVPILAGEDDAASDMGDPDAMLRRMLRDGTAAQRRDLVVSFGQQRLDYLAAGGKVADLAARRENPGWRPAYVVRPLRELAA